MISALLALCDINNSIYVIGRMDYEELNPSSYQYTLTPYWDVIDFLPKNVFSGIPGYDLREKKEMYYRINMTPSFITMRTPSTSREDFYALASEVFEERYNRFEWLINTKRLSSFDNLFLIPYRNPRTYEGVLDEEQLNNLFRDDVVKINNICNINSSNAKLAYNLYRLLVSGCQIYIENEMRYIQPIERSSMLYLLRNMLNKYDDYFNKRQNEGILKAKEEGKFAGRKKKQVDPTLLRDVTKRFRTGKITETEAMNILNIASRSTLYRRMKEVEENT